MIGKIVSRSAPRTILDIGCGSGSMLKSLQSSGTVLSGVDIEPAAIRRCRRLIPSASIFQAEANELPLESGSQELVLALDIIEHSDNDSGIIGEAYRVLKQGGRLVVTVPAYRRLYGQRDKEAGHKRRYNKKDLVSLLKKEGFHISYSNYYNFILFPLFVLSRSIGLNDREPGKQVNYLFTRVMGIENKLAEHVKFPFGSTLVAVGEKRDV